MEGTVIAGIGVLAATVWIYFGPAAALGLVLIAGLTRWRPDAGAALLFFAVSIDASEPVFGRLYISLSELELAACILAWGAGRIAPGADWRRIDWRPLAWGAPFLSAVLISALFNNEWLRILPNCLRVWEFLFAMWLAADGLAGSRRRWFAAAIAAAALFHSVSAMLQLPELGRARAFSWFASPNQFAAYVNLLLPFAIVFLLEARNRALRIAWATLVGLTATTALAAQSRAGLAAGLGGAACVAFFHLRHRRRRLPKTPDDSRSISARGLKTAVIWAATTTILALILALAVPQSAATAGDWFGLFKTRLAAIHSGDLLKVRSAYYAIGWEIFKDHPLIGIGPGNHTRQMVHYEDLVERYRTEVRYFRSFRRDLDTHVHNLFLQLGIDYGVLGLLAFLFLVWRITGALLAEIEQSAWKLAGAGILAAFLIHNLADVTIPSLGIETGLALGAALARRRRLGEGGAGAPGPRLP